MILWTSEATNNACFIGSCGHQLNPPSIADICCGQDHYGATWQKQSLAKVTAISISIYTWAIYSVRHPHLTVFVREIDSTEAIPCLESSELDLAFVRLDGEISAGIAMLPLAEDRLAVALPNTHPLAA